MRCALQSFSLGDEVQSRTLKSVCVSTVPQWDSDSCLPAYWVRDGSVMTLVSPIAFARWMRRNPIEGWLSRTEQDQFRGFRQKRASDWLAGRLAIKLSAHALPPVRQSVKSLTGIQVSNRLHGAPEVRVRGLDHSFAVSVSHSQGWGIAVASLSAERIGVDIEHERRNLTVATWDLARGRVNPSSSDALDHQTLVHWVTSEAAAKAWGIPHFAAIELLASTGWGELSDSAVVRYGRRIQPSPTSNGSPLGTPLIQIWCQRPRAWAVVSVPRDHPSEPK